MLTRVWIGVAVAVGTRGVAVGSVGSPRTVGIRARVAVGGAIVGVTVDTGGCVSGTGAV